VTFDNAAWYAILFLFGVIAPIILRDYQDKLKPLLGESYQALALSFIWLGAQLAAAARPTDITVMAGWLFIYAFGSLILLYGRMEKSGR